MHGLEQLHGDRFHIDNIGHFVDQHDEFVTAPAGDGVDGTHRGAQRISHRDQHAVAGSVAELVVVDLEVINVDHDDAQAAAITTNARQRLGDAVVEQCAIGQSGELIVGGEKTELLFFFAQRLHARFELTGAGDEATLKFACRCLQRVNHTLLGDQRFACRELFFTSNRRQAIR